VSDLPGLESRRHIVAGGAAADLAAAGLRWATGVRAGGRRRLCRAVRGASRPVPAGAAGLTDIEAASLPETFFTVWQNVFDIAACRPARRCWCRAAPAASASPPSSWPRRWARPVIVTAGSDDKCAACVALGADRHQLPHAGLRRRGASA
jgi:NADPH2:quinone reductase